MVGDPEQSDEGIIIESENSSNNSNVIQPINNGSLQEPP